MPVPRKYTDELRERSVRMVKETLGDNPGMGLRTACSQVGDQLGIPAATLRNWLRSGRSSAPGQVAGGSPGPVDAAGRIAQLEKENRELRRANAILKSASAFFAAELDRPSPR
ncbi:transposase [Monashia sp. NPDC004114]